MQNRRNQLLTRPCHLRAPYCGQSFDRPPLKKIYAMYAEKHSFQNRYTRWLQIVCTALALWQLTAFLGAETGLSWLPFGYMAHVSLLFIAVCLLILLNRAGLSLRVSTKGWVLRFFPFQFQSRCIYWEEVKNVRWLKPGELPQHWNLVDTDRSFGHVFLITHADYDVVCIELASGFQIFVSVQKPVELIEFLHNRLLQPKLKNKMLG